MIKKFKSFKKGFAFAGLALIALILGAGLSRIEGAWRPGSPKSEYSALERKVLAEVRRCPGVTDARFEPASGTPTPELWVRVVGPGSASILRFPKNPTHEETLVSLAAIGCTPR
ncbi:MAG: hypothetical protein AAF430_18465 [Myxococcota bacterium]